MVDDRAVFLDLRRDLYLALDSTAAPAFDAVRSSPNGAVGSAQADTLLGTGLFEPSDERRPLRPARIGAATGDLPADRSRPGLKDMLEILLLLARYRRAVRRQPLEAILSARRGRLQDSSGALPASTAAALAKRFASARALIPIAPVCLQDSLALHDWLARRGARSSLVLAVRLDPFAAHCWVQHGKTVLNDAADRVAVYSPVLVVE